MKRKLGIFCIILGTALVIAALFLFLQNQQEDETARQAVSEAMADIKTEIAQAETNEPELQLNTPVELLKPEDLIMTEKEINGHMYIGYLSVPELELELPVMSQWSYSKLRISPCRYSGTLKGEDLVILAHNYPSHFRRISQLQEGSEVLFTDMDGDIWRYEVAILDVLAAEDVEEMTAGDYDLTLFTCTSDRIHRHTIRCNLVK